MDDEKKKKILRFVQCAVTVASLMLASFCAGWTNFGVQANGWNGLVYSVNGVSGDSTGNVAVSQVNGKTVNSDVPSTADFAAYLQNAEDITELQEKLENVGIKELLWENPNPTSAFSLTSTITLSKSADEYDALLFLVRKAASANITAEIGLTKPVLGSTGDATWGYVQGGDYYRFSITTVGGSGGTYTRIANFSDSAHTKITFSGGNSTEGVPIAVYGVKNGLFEFDGDATAEDVLAGKTFYSNSGTLQTGTLDTSFELVWQRSLSAMDATTVTVTNYSNYSHFLIVGSNKLARDDIGKDITAFLSADDDFCRLAAGMDGAEKRFFRNIFTHATAGTIEFSNGWNGYSYQTNSCVPLRIYGLKKELGNGIELW